MSADSRCQVAKILDYASKKGDYAGSGSPFCLICGLNVFLVLEAMNRCRDTTAAFDEVCAVEVIDLHDRGTSQ